ncbi:uncharacterized protein LOC143893768 [Temnothorax americanus]|uniref:uncharacterized protein LOC143893768 n=1 Tax=Temnothorax americanus TaxID=1964332 RepID=UPI004068F1AA
MAERGCGLGIAAELHRVPRDHSLWAGSRCGLAAITWRRTAEPVPCSKFEAGDGFVVVKWGRVYVASVYVSPNLDAAQYEEVLADLRACISRIPLAQRQIVVAGDFNAKSALWGSPVTNRRGRILETWAAGLDLVIVNSGQRTDTVTRGTQWPSLPQPVSEFLSMINRVTTPSGDTVRVNLAVAASSEEVDEAAGWIGGLMMAACDAAMPRVKPMTRKAAY